MAWRRIPYTGAPFRRSDLFRAKEKAPTGLVELVGAVSHEEEMTLITYRLTCLREILGEQIVTSCEYFVYSPFRLHPFVMGLTGKTDGIKFTLYFSYLPLTPRYRCSRMGHLRRAAH